uniref:SNF1-related protein kinase regulatory subunit beta-2 n=1 Tax=Anthurium amnicola TaxID=1678845 RepID=A0A1D1ZLK0_9ARAE
MAPLQRLDEIHLLKHGSRHNTTEYEDIFSGQGIPTMITWSHGGKEVAVEGSWDNWRTKQPLQRSGLDFNIMKVLPSGVYQYKFIVDGEWRYSPDLPWGHNEMGNACNILDLQDFVPDDIENVAGFEPPQSPDSSYNNWALGSEDFSKEPPLVPPQLHVTLLNTPSFVENQCSVSRPQPVVLNHLYIQKSKNCQPMVALGVSHRFRSKFVTVVLYKSLQS